MLAGTRHHTRARRGIVLVLVLAMLGLLALIGVTFATFSGQARINARNFAQSVIRPQDDELMDFALQQLITDTGDPRSVIRGHSLARDMFGNDASNNGYLAANPVSGGSLLIQKIQASTTVAGTYEVETNIPTPASVPAMYGYDFTRWIMRVAYTGTINSGSPIPVGQTCEILLDDYGQYGNITAFSGQGYHVFRIALLDPAQATVNGTGYNPTTSQLAAAGGPAVAIMPNNWTVLNNPTLGYISYNQYNPYPGWPSTASNAAGTALVQAFNASNVNTVAFTLDGRWLHAFNGPGMGTLYNSFTLNHGTYSNISVTVPMSAYGNFRYNGLQPNSAGMDEDYDACDLENWFLALQSADGQVMIPSFHRPGIVRYQDSNSTTNKYDWDPAFRSAYWTDSASRILRPVAADGHDAATFPDLIPDPTTGKITYDVDNDGDGVTDSVWLDLGYPAHRDSNGNLYKPLFAFMVIGLNGRIPLNTAGNLAGTGATHSQHLGNSTSEIDPTYGLQNAYVPYNSSTPPSGNPSGDADPFNQLLNAVGPGTSGIWAGPHSTFSATGSSYTTNFTQNTQVDNSIDATPTDSTYNLYQSVDVRLTQLRNLLAGTRPHKTPLVNPLTTDAGGTTNGDDNAVYGAWPGSGQGAAYYLPNGISDGNDVSTYTYTNGTSNYPLVQRTGTPVAGRWGEAASVPGVPFTNPSGGPPLNLVQTRYANPVRAGYSFDPSDMLTYLQNGTTFYDANGDIVFPADVADDNHNAYDVFPARTTGEVGDADFYDAAGALLLPVERMRRFVTPVDINGTGRVQTWMGTSDLGPDNFGRVQFSSYFRPAGVAGQVNVTTPFPSITVPTPVTSTMSPYGATAAGPYTTSSTTTTGIFGSWSDGTLTAWASGNNYSPDLTNNPLHGYESYKIPNRFQNPGDVTPQDYVSQSYNPWTYGGMPINMNALSATTYGAATYYDSASMAAKPGIPSGLSNVPTVPTTLPTYNNTVNASIHSDGVNEADEMNLYTPNPLLDSPYGPSDLEWLYRQQDVDGSTLTSRLSQLAPVSFTNTIDSQRRRRLYALDSWESNSFVWANDNPAAPGALNGAFANNSRFSAVPSQTLPNPSYQGNSVINVANAGFASLSAIRTAINGTTLLSAPSLAHRDKKINLNYPLPVSNDPNEPVRQKWIYETYQLLKWILPPTAVDSPEELAQLSQFVINIIDFRDPDATMTHWVNPDLWITPGTQQVLGSGTVYTYPVLTIGSVPGTIPGNLAPGCVPLDQYGMEYNPVAINEVLAYGFQSQNPASATPTNTYTNRFFIELVNTLTAAYNPAYDYGNSASATLDPGNYYGYGPSNVNGNNNNATTPPYQNVDATAPPMQASTLDLGGFTYVAGDPYQGGCWDLVFTADNAMSRPDPYRGDLIYNPNVSAAAGQYNYFGLIPLNRDINQSASAALPNGGDVTLIPLPPNANTVALSATTTNSASSSPNYPFNPPLNQPAQPINYFYVIGSQPSNNEAGTLTTTSKTTATITVTPPQGQGTTQPTSTTMSFPTVSELLAPGYDPMSTGSAPTSFQWHPGILPGSAQGTTTGQATGATSGQPSNFWWKLPTFGVTGGSFGGVTGALPPTAPVSGSAVYYWVCLRRPANPFAPVSATNPMVVVDSMRFPYIDGSPPYSATTWTNPTSTQWQVNSGTANTIYSSQRLQPYRGGHAVPMPNAPGTTTTTMPPDPRYGYTDQIAVPQTYQRTTYGLANTQTAGGATGNASTNYYYHTLGFPNDSAENWDYPVFNDRDFSSVAELLLVPGCPPGLFTKQFAEFAPSQLNAANIFSTVSPVLSTQPSPALYSSSFGGTASQSTNYPTPFTTATLPFLSVSNLSATTALKSTLSQWSISSTSYNQPGTPVNSTAATTPVQPHAFPYLVDKFFYTGASSFLYPPNSAAMDPGSPTLKSSAVPIVGGPGGDGWFKMFEFFEVPSQMIGAIGPVAQGANFDWARQDSKPGLMNLNLIIDEEAFFSVFGRQSDTNFNQGLLNSIELPLLLNTAGVSPYSMPLGTQNNNAPPIPLGGPPVPLVVSAIQPNGAPNYVYPITNQSLYSPQGYLANDPIQSEINKVIISNSGTVMPPVGNRIKAAFAQFLWARHGGSGYLFGHGVGATGQNNAVTLVNNQVNGGPVPSERPFHSLSYPDINYTIMRPAALPPSTSSNPVMANANPVTNALMTEYLPTSVSGWNFQPTGTMGYCYAPFTANIISGNASGNTWGTNTPLAYTGDPGTRNPFLNQGYVTGAYINPASPTTTTSGVAPPYQIYVPVAAINPLTPYLTTSSNTVPAGVPIPVNVAITSGTTITDGVAMPTPIPATRLFQAPDAYGAGLMQKLTYTGIMTSDGSTTYGNLPPPVSGATDSGDPWINNQVANQLSSPYVTGDNPLTYNMGSYPPSYTLSNGFTSLAWPQGGSNQAGGMFYNNSSTAPPLVPPTGSLPPTSINYPPYTSSASLALGNLTFTNGYGSSGVTAANPYLGSNAGGNTDDRQHPYWRTELLQKAMNLTTVRTHQYAVWITIGFFEVKRQGDIGMLAQGAPLLAFDIMGPEVGALNGQNVRFRGFFLVDRLQLTGFNPGSVGAFHNAIVYRKVIQ